MGPKIATKIHPNATNIFHITFLSMALFGSCTTKIGLLFFEPSKCLGTPWSPWSTSIMETIESQIVQKG